VKNIFYRYSRFYNKLYKNPDEYVVACNYFNVIKSHYNYFFYPKKIKFIKSFFNFFLRYLKKCKKNNIKKKKILIISNFISSKYIFKNDFYFSHLIENLKRNSFHIYYRNIEEKNYSNKKNSFFYLGSTDRNIVKDLYYIFRIIYKLVKLRVFYNNKDSFSAIAINKCFDIKNILSTLSNINEVDKIISFIEKCQPKKIFFTYEGYAWEKLFIFRLKKKYPNILLFGFYFSIISQYQNSPFLPKIRQLIPDYILTSGNVQRKKFIKYDFNENKIFNIGSNKKLFHLKKNIHLKRNKKIILLPEAFIEEVLSFINFAKKCSKIISDKFILRLHPSLLDNIEMNKIIKQKIVNTNIFISNQKIEKDFNLSRVAIYRGSSSVIQAVNYGLIPTYLAIKNELSIDPLFEISKYIKRIKNPLDLKKMTMIDSYSYHKNLVKVQNYCKNYFMSRNQKNIKKIISFEST
jgi:hypothetical protein